MISCEDWEIVQMTMTAVSKEHPDSYMGFQALPFSSLLTLEFSTFNWPNIWKLKNLEIFLKVGSLNRSSSFLESSYILEFLK